MKKKGFTLVELLAVIVILAIIALIAIPLIGNVIEKAKIGALEASVNGLVESANMYYANKTIKDETISEITFDFKDGEQISEQKLDYKGKVYNGKLILHASGNIVVCLDDEEHYAYKNKDTDEIVSGVGTCLYDGTTGDFSNIDEEHSKEEYAKFMLETNHVGLQGKNWVIDTTAEFISTITLTFQRKTTYGYLLVAGGNTYPSSSGYSDCSSTEYTIIKKVTDKNLYEITIDVSTYDYIIIAEAYDNNQIANVEITDITFK